MNQPYSKARRPFKRRLLTIYTVVFLAPVVLLYATVGMVMLVAAVGHAAHMPLAVAVGLVWLTPPLTVVTLVLLRRKAKSRRAREQAGK